MRYEMVFSKRATALASMLVALAAAGSGSELAQVASAACQLDEARALMAQSPRPVARLDALLADCARVAPGDWQVPWLQGVVARDSRQLDVALASLQRAVTLAPTQAAPALDLAVTHEWRNEPAQARRIYDDLLRADPASRPALLGSARVARSQGRIDDARAIYSPLQQQNAADTEALNGLAWADLAGLHLDASRQGFERVLAAEPANAEALQGLDRLTEQWRYRLELLGGHSSLAAGGVQTASAGLLINRNATDQIELVLGRNSRELPSERLTDPTPLPSWQSRLGYRSRTTGGLDWATAYEYRERRNSPAEHRVELRLGSRFSGQAQALQWFAGVRQSFSSPWNSRLASVGLSADVARHWSVAGTLYAGEDRTAGSSKAYALDAYRETSALGSFLNVGVGYNPEPDNLSVHARWVYPVAPMQALVLSLERRSLGRETEASVGWRVYWR